jgi:hypothetical protein
MQHNLHWGALLLACGLVCSTDAAVQEFTERAAWESAAGAYSTIDFTGYPLWTELTTQYTKSHGVTFTQPAFIFNSVGYLNDEWGAIAYLQTRIAFDIPRCAVAIDGTSFQSFRLFRNGQLMYNSQLFGPHLGYFGGLVSEFSFDEVEIYTEGPPFETHVVMDDLLIGQPIPAPGAIGAFALAALIGRRRRRRADWCRRSLML